MLMVGFSFQFQGVGAEQSALLGALLAGIGLVLIGLGLWLLARRRWRLAAACLVIVVLASAAAGALLRMGISAGGAWMILLAKGDSTDEQDLLYLQQKMDQYTQQSSHFDEVMARFRQHIEEARLAAPTE